ncbi:thiamine pyrophosphate-dependent enzyme [Halobacteriovorax sp.]|uniref:thiamine pyrophosphate-dependent enzyme n=1 Tax=Halobacteriovorax sp. TaxID=2020862 RepID=UPI003AF2F9FE
MAEYRILNGNELIIQGALEAGFNLYTGYPGSPLADYFNILYKKKNEMHEKGIRVVIANSEANAAAMASGVKQAGRDCLVAMKSMGLHVASDALSVGNFANPAKPEIIDGREIYPATVICVGDDPWSMSTSTAADSRYLFKHLHMSFLEPSNPTELKDWIAKAKEISSKTSLYQGLLLSTFLAEGGGRVECFEEAKIDGELIDVDPSTFDLQKNVMVPPNSLFADISMIKERFPKVKEVLKEMKLDARFGNENSKIGFISSGVIFETLKQCLEEGDYLEHFSLYKVASSFPLVDDLLIPYLKGLKKLVVVEEKRGFLEGEVRSLCQKHGIEIEIVGKEFGENEGFPAYGGLSFEIISEKLEALKDFLEIGQCKSLAFEERNFGEILPKRLPTFCPGCPHRETLSLLKDLRRWLKAQDIDLITHGDVGCYSLSFLPPFGEMHNLSAMGQGGALGAGMDLFTKNPSVVLMGDSTFFHSGITDISNSVQADHDITYILLDNDNTAMTGHQMTPASQINVEGSKRPKQDMLNIVQNLGVKTAKEVHPSDRYFYKNLMRDFVTQKGVKVIISNKECSLTYQAKIRASERNTMKNSGVLKEKTFYQINTSACEDCRVCIEETGCPGLTQVFDAYGTKMGIDPTICVADSYCTKFKVCPSFEKVTVKNFHPTKYRPSDFSHLDFDLKDVETKKTFDDIAQGDTWRMVVTGVGGSGITTISKIIANASIKMAGRDDLDFKFMDQKGLAQRNGNVTGHMSICHKTKSMGAVTPRGASDVLLSPDLLDGIGQLGFLHSENGVAVFDDSYQVPLSIMLDKGLSEESLTKQKLIEKVKSRNDERIIMVPLKKWCNLFFGKAVYASSMILGYAYQLGLVPFSDQDLLDALGNSIKKSEVDNNIAAFRLGQEMASLGVEEFERKHNELKVKEETTLNLAIASLKDSLLPWHNTNYFISKFKENLDKAIVDIPWMKKRHLIQILHDQFIYNRGKDTTEFISGARAISTIVSEENRVLATQVLAKTYFVKDEVMVAHLMLSPFLKQMEDKTYGALGTGIVKQRINRPSFDILNKKIEFDISPKNWQLKLMRHFRVLRTLLPSWHHKERAIAKTTRDFLFNGLQKVDNEYHALKLLDNIKGYRDVRYEKAQNAFNELGIN